MDFSVWRSVPGLFHALALGVTALVISAALGAPAYAGDVTTGSVLKAAKAAIANQRGVHVVFVVSTSSSSNTEKITADVGRTSGLETISEGKANLAVEVTPTYAYVNGNSSGLTTIDGLSSAEAKKVGTNWVSWKAGTSQYSDLKSVVTISSVTTVLPKANGTKLSTHITTGTKLYVLKWTTAATSSSPKLSNTLSVSARGTTLPVKETATASGGTKVTTMFSKWGEHIIVSAPPGASTISSSQVTG
jgi:hypothetical protein